MAEKVISKTWNSGAGETAQHSPLATTGTRHACAQTKNKNLKMFFKNPKNTPYHILYAFTNTESRLINVCHKHFPYILTSFYDYPKT